LTVLHGTIAHAALYPLSPRNGAAFFFLSQAVRTLPVGVANALWSGFSVILVAISGYIVHRQVLSLPSISGLLLICGGTALMYFGTTK
jgi:small multidrug resistance pump